MVRNLSDSTDLKAILTEKIPKEQERVKSFRKEFGNKVVGEVTVDMVMSNVFGRVFCTLMMRFNKPNKIRKPFGCRCTVVCEVLKD